MGIDAQIMIRIQQEAPSNDQLLRWSWDLANCIGPENFFTHTDPKWGEPQSAITLAHHWEENGSVEIRDGHIFTQDGPYIEAQPGETLLEVHLAGRYYGVGYERGPILTFIAIADWIDANIPTAEVWYGGDSSGVLMEPFPQSERLALQAHFFGPHGQDYRKFDPRGTFPTPPPCALCVPNENRFDRYGWGGGDQYVAVHCGGCGKRFVSQNGGETWDEEN